MDSLVPNQRKKQLMPDSTMEPPAGHNIRHLSHLRHKTSGETSSQGATSYPACSGVRFYPWGGRRRCFLAARPAFPGSWQNKPSRRCNHRQTSSGSPSCCGGTSCWSPANLSTCCRQYLKCLKQEFGLLMFKTFDLIHTYNRSLMRAYDTKCTLVYSLNVCWLAV